jgi:hypothetical protein
MGVLKSQQAKGLTLDRKKILMMMIILLSLSYLGRNREKLRDFIQLSLYLTIINLYTFRK